MDMGFPVVDGLGLFDDAVAQSGLGERFTAEALDYLREQATPQLERVTERDDPTDVKRRITAALQRVHEAASERGLADSGIVDRGVAESIVGFFHFWPFN